MHFIEIILEKREDYACMQETKEKDLRGDRWWQLELAHDSGSREMWKGLGNYIIYWKYKKESIGIDCQVFVINK